MEARAEPRIGAAYAQRLPRGIEAPRLDVVSINNDMRNAGPPILAVVPSDRVAIKGKGSCRIPGITCELLPLIVIQPEIPWATVGDIRASSPMEPLRPARKGTYGTRLIPVLFLEGRDFWGQARRGIGDTAHVAGRSVDRRNPRCHSLDLPRGPAPRSEALSQRVR